MTNLTQGNTILVNLTMDKVKNFYPSNAGFQFDKILHGLTAANVAKDKMDEIIYQAIPEAGQR